MSDLDAAAERISASLNPQPVADMPEPSEPAETEAPEPEERPRYTAKELCERYSIPPDEFYSARLVLDGEAGEEVSLSEWKDARRDVKRAEQARQEVEQETARAHDTIAQAQARVAHIEQAAVQADHLFQAALEQHQRDAQSVAWQFLQDTDPAEFHAKQMEFQARDNELRSMMNRAAELRMHADQERQAHEFASLERHYKAQQAELLRLVPEFDSRKHGHKPIGEFLSWAESKGFPPQAINQIADARLVAALHAQMIQETKLAPAVLAKLKLVKNGKRMLTPGARGPLRSVDHEAVKARATLKRTGRHQDAAKVIRTMLK